MTLALDTSALLALAVDGPQRRVVLDALDADPVWCASAMALTEALPAIDRLTDEPIVRADLEDAIRLAWDYLHVVPIDQRCLDRAANLSRLQPVRLTDAIHLAAAERLPAPVAFVTFDPAQIGVALGPRIRRGEQLTVLARYRGDACHGSGAERRGRH